MWQIILLSICAILCTLCIFFYTCCSFHDGFQPLWNDTQTALMSLVIKDIFEFPGVCLISEALLGQERHGGQPIPWNTKVCVIVPEKDRYEFRSHIGDKDRLVMDSQHKWDLIQLKHGFPQEYGGHRFPFVFVYYYSASSTQVTWEEVRVWGRSERYTVPKDDLLPLQTATFIGVDVKVPSHTRNILHQRFGDHWSVTAQPTKCDYRTGRWIPRAVIQADPKTLESVLEPIQVEDLSGESDGEPEPDD